MASKTYLSYPHRPIILLMIGYVLVAFYLGVYLQYDFFRSDVLGYWNTSLPWQTPFHRFHVPGYPLAIALLRGVTFSNLPPIILMMGINLGALLVSVYLIYRITQAGGASDESGTIGAYLFGLWPFVGLTFTVMPLADLPSISLLLGGLYSLQRSRRLPAAFLFGLSILTHKAMWLFAGLLMMGDFLSRKEYISRRNILFIGITLLPIAAYWLLGSYQHQSLTWIVSSNLEKEFVSQSRMRLLDGLIGTLMTGDLKGIVKGILVLGLAILSAASVYLSGSLKYEHFIPGMMLSAAALTLFIVLNQHEIWAAVRFSRLLVIPLVLIANNRFQFWKASWWRFPVKFTLVLTLFASQFAFAWYLGRILFP